jgi:superfamily II DNA or RNA helicase
LGFESLSLARHYDSDAVDISSDFYRPLLRNAIRYDRAVGYFSSSALRECAAELRSFVSIGGRIRLVVGLLVSNADIVALQHEGQALDEIERQNIRGVLMSYLDDLVATDFKAAQTFAKLVSSGVAELKFAVRDRGIYHEKFGIFEDDSGLKVAFIGSVNETASAMTQEINHESCAVFQSVEPAIYVAYGLDLERRFEKLWNGETRHTRIYALDSVSLERMQELAQRHPPSEPTEENLVAEKVPSYFELRPYQLDAIRAWQAQDLRGILAMATGTGKTLTAIDAVKRVKANLPGSAVVVTVPYQNLATQWLQALRDQGIDAVGVFDSHTRWYDEVRNQFAAARYSDTVPMACIVCVNASFKDDRFQGLLGLLSEAKQPDHLLVVDECHHFNSREHLTKLPKHFSMRLGLSATPYDQFSEHHLEEYFGKIAYEFPLGRAIREGFLSKYQYTYFCCELDEEETAAYVDLTQKIIRIAGSDEKFSAETLAKAQHLLLARARIVGAAKDKLVKLEAHLTRQGRVPYTLFYCGDGAVEEEGQRLRQVEKVTDLLHSLGWKSSRVTATESLHMRQTLLDHLGSGLIDAVVSIRVLDEGIDVPVCRTAYLLASQSSDRQGIQRRGRVLRLSPGKDVAFLYDFLVVSGSGRPLPGLAMKEIRRAYQFAHDASNGQELFDGLVQLQESLGLSVGDPNAAETTGKDCREPEGSAVGVK